MGRMMTWATGFVYGPENVGMVASTGCNTVHTSTYPYNPYTIPWANSLFENGATFAMGVRSRWNQMGWQDKKLWVVGGDGAFLDIGFQSLSRMMMSGMDIKVLVLDTQVYSNVYVAQTTCAHFNHFLPLCDGSQRIRRSSCHRRLHDLPTRAWCGRQRSHAASQTVSRFPRLPTHRLRSTER